MLNNKSDASVAENSATTAVHFKKEAFAISLFSTEYGCFTLPPIFQPELLQLLWLGFVVVVGFFFKWYLSGSSGD